LEIWSKALLHKDAKVTSSDGKTQLVKEYVISNPEKSVIESISRVDIDDICIKFSDVSNIVLNYKISYTDLISKHVGNIIEKHYPVLMK